MTMGYLFQDAGPAPLTSVLRSPIQTYPTLGVPAGCARTVCGQATAAPPMRPNSSGHRMPAQAQRHPIGSTAGLIGLMTMLWVAGYVRFGSLTDIRACGPDGPLATESGHCGSLRFGNWALWHKSASGRCHSISRPFHNRSLREFVSAHRCEIPWGKASNSSF